MLLKTFKLFKTLISIGQKSLSYECSKIYLTKPLFMDFVFLLPSSPPPPTLPFFPPSFLFTHQYCLYLQLFPSCGFLEEHLLGQGLNIFLIIFIKL